MFIKDYVLRYSDLDRNGEVKICSVIDLLQDISIAHCDAVGFSTEKMAGMQVAWLLDGWRIKVFEKLDPKKKVTVKTGIMKIKATQTERKYEVWQGDELKIKAGAIWFTVDTSAMRIIRVPEGFLNAYNVVDEDEDCKFLKFKSGDGADFVRKTKVERRDLDTNNHMNNVKSAEVLVNVMPEGFNVADLLIRYRKELALGEEIAIRTKDEDGDFYGELVNSENQVCVMMKGMTK